MGRTAERIIIATPTGTLTTALTVPAGHKYEMVDWSAGAFGNAGAVYVTETDAVFSGLQFLDEAPLAAGQFAVHHDWSCGVLYEGDLLQVLWLGGAATTAVFVISYIDVNMT